jgi:DNA-binding NarL/FixJ family response regulator
MQKRNSLRRSRLGLESKRIRVLLADDHQMFLAGLHKLLESDFEIVGAVGDGRALREQAVQLNPDVIVADISMPLLNGIDAVRSMRDGGCAAKVIFLTMHGDELYVQQATRAGAVAYILKRDAPDRLVSAIRQAASGGNQAGGTGLLPSGDGQEGASRDGEILTDRQREIWQLLAEGNSPKQIAGLLGVSARTVEFHKYQIMKRLKVSNAAELTAVAIRHGIITATE